MASWIGKRIGAVIAAGAIAITGGVVVDHQFNQSSGGAPHTCDSTISSGANIATAVSSLTAGGTLCLNAGTYSGFTYLSSGYPFVSDEISKSSMTTIRPANGVSQSQVSVSSYVGRSNNLKFQDVTITGGAIGTPSGTDSPGTNLIFQNIHYIGCFIIYQPDAAVMNITMDGGTFDSVGSSGNSSPCGDDGRLRINGLNTGNQSGNPNVAIKNIDFATQAGCTDGIAITGGGNGIHIGPGNSFHGIIQNNPVSCLTHIDPVQFYGANAITIDSNYFYNNTDGVMSSNGNGDNATVTNNVFSTSGDGYAWAIVDCGGDGWTVKGNVFADSNARLNICLSTTPLPIDATSTTIVRDNYLAGGMSEAASSGQTDYTGITADHNMCPTGTTVCNNGTGTVGTATYVGGSTPSVFSGFVLIGPLAALTGASDGGIIGIR